MAEIATKAEATCAQGNGFVISLTWEEWKAKSAQEQRWLTSNKCIHIHGDGAIVPCSGITSFSAEDNSWGRHFDMHMPHAVHGEKLTGNYAFDYKLKFLLRLLRPAYRSRRECTDSACIAQGAARAL